MTIPMPRGGGWWYAEGQWLDVDAVEFGRDFVMALCFRFWLMVGNQVCVGRMFACKLLALALVVPVLLLMGRDEMSV